MGALNVELVVPTGDPAGHTVSEDGSVTARDRALPALRDQIRALSRDLRVTRQLMFREAGVPLGGLGLLTVIGRTPPGQMCRGKDLAAECALDASTVSRFVGALVDRGLVERQPYLQDGRASGLVITPAGRQVLQEAEAWGKDLLTTVLGSWPDTEVAHLVSTLGRFVGDLGNELDQRSSAVRATR